MTSIDDHSAGSGADNFPIVITALPATVRQHRFAFVASALLVAIIVVLMFANIPMPRVYTFVPVIQSVMCLTDLLTAAFLFAQYSVQPRYALLALAGGFVFSGLFAFLQTLAYPGAYEPGALIGNELSSSGWLFLCWHTTFPLAVIAYALLKDVPAPKRSGRSIAVNIGVTIACVVAATAGLTWGATAGAAYLPVLHKNLLELQPLSNAVGFACLLVTSAAIVVMFMRRRTILGHWLILTLFAWLPTFFVTTLFDINRFTLGWYVARIYALFAGSSLLWVLLTETLFLYTRLASAVSLLRQSEQRQQVLIAELDHRVKNILAQVVGVATFTREGSRSLDGFLLSLAGRIQSMAAAHTLLSRAGWQGVGLDAIVRTELAPYTTDTNIMISGTDVVLAAAETQALAKVLHELATNAVKYGALSLPAGQVSVTWDRKANGQAAILVLDWREAGGPPVAFKGQSSYGTDLIRGLIAHELGGVVDLVFAAEGLRCRIEFPVKPS